MMNQEKGKKVMKKYKEKGGYSVKGLEHRVTYFIRIMFMNYNLQGEETIVKTKFIHMKHSFFLQILHKYLNSSWRLFFYTVLQLLVI